MDGFYVTFDAQNGAKDAVLKVGYPDGSIVSAPTYAISKTEVSDAPVYAGHTFLGWYTDSGEKYSFDKEETENFTLTAKWQESGTATTSLNVTGNALEAFASDI